MRKIITVLAMLSVFAVVPPVLAQTPLADAVNALQISSGGQPEVSVWDVDGDERIALPEAIHALEAAAGLRDLSKEDPLFPFQWHLRNTGQKTFSPAPGKVGEDMRMTGAMAEGLDGTGVIVAVVDTGLEIAHEDIKDNIVSGGSWNFIDSTTDPTHPTEEKGDHGTSVAGVVAAAAGNGKGGRGVAPRAKLKGFNYIANDTVGVDSNEIASLGGSDNKPNARDVHVFNMSYGDDDTAYTPLDQTKEDFWNSIPGGLRDGKGAIYVKSSGNGYVYVELSATTYYVCKEDPLYPEAIKNLDVGCQNAVGEEVNSRPELIVVGAFNANGVKSSYSTPGSVLWISAPGGEYGHDYPAVLTIDQSGCEKGYSRSRDRYDAESEETPANDFQTGETQNSGRHNPNCNYASDFNGTSAAAPNASGAIALILQANPNLTTREMKYILARTARQIDPAIAARTVQIGETSYTAEQPWIVNAAGFHFHNWYGFGAVNVDAAVAMARNWTSVLGTRQEKEYGGALDPPVAIPDADAAGITQTLEIGDDLTIENLVVGLKVDHSNPGEIAVELTSPAETKSIILNLRSGLKSGMKDGAALGSNAFYGEKSKGRWKLRILDGVTGNSGTLGHFAIKLIGY
jgi:subtilisin family serine protease/subtilisin-like proprotein convertase family protein